MVSQAALPPVMSRLRIGKCHQGLCFYCPRNGACMMGLLCRHGHRGQAALHPPPCRPSRSSLQENLLPETDSEAALPLCSPLHVLSGRGLSLLIINVKYV